MLGSYQNVPKNILDVFFHNGGISAYSKDEVYDLLESSILELLCTVWEIVIDGPSF